MFQQKADTGCGCKELCEQIRYKMRLCFHTSCNEAWLTKSPALSFHLICCWPATDKNHLPPHHHHQWPKPLMFHLPLIPETFLMAWAFTLRLINRKIWIKFNGVFTLATSNLTLAESCSVYLHAVPTVRHTAYIVCDSDFHLNSTCILCTGNQRYGYRTNTNEW